MSKYSIEFTTFWAASLNEWCDNIDPADFLDCEDEDELYDCFREYVTSNSDTPMIPKGLDLYDFEEYGEIEFPEGFLEEWKRLKAEQEND